MTPRLHIGRLDTARGTILSRISDHRRIGLLPFPIDPGTPRIYRDKLTLRQARSRENEFREILEPLCHAQRLAVVSRRRTRLGRFEGAEAKRLRTP